MNERILMTALIPMILLQPVSLTADPMLSRDEIALLVESERSYSSEEVTDLLATVIEIADEELGRMEEEADQTRVRLQECLIENRIREKETTSNRRRNSFLWMVAGVLTGVVGSMWVYR